MWRPRSGGELLNSTRNEEGLCRDILFVLYFRPGQDLGKSWSIVRIVLPAVLHELGQKGGAVGWNGKPLPLHTNRKNHLHGGGQLVPRDASGEALPQEHSPFFARRMKDD